MDRLLVGLMNTVLLSATGLLLSLLIGVVFAAGLMSGNRFVVRLTRALVDTMRCIPFLLLAYLVYYALPSLGLNFNNWTSGCWQLSFTMPATWPRSCAAFGLSFPGNRSMPEAHLVFTVGTSICGSSSRRSCLRPS